MPGSCSGDPDKDTKNFGTETRRGVVFQSQTSPLLHLFVESSLVKVVCLPQFQTRRNNGDFTQWHLKSHALQLKKGFTPI